MHTWSGTERNSSRSGSHSNFFGSWSDLDPFLESWNGSGMDRFIRDKNQFSSGSYDNIFCKNSMSDSMDSIEVQIVWFLIEGATTLSRTTWSLLWLTYSCWKTFHQSKNCTEGWMLLPLHQSLLNVFSVLGPMYLAEGDSSWVTQPLRSKLSSMRTERGNYCLGQP